MLRSVSRFSSQLFRLLLPLIGDFMPAIGDLRLAVNKDCLLSLTVAVCPGPCDNRPPG